MFLSKAYNFFYNIGMWFFQTGIIIASPFSKKIQQRHKGELQTWDILHQACKTDSYIWFHAASLGEFEQGRPIIEQIKTEHPDTKILLTFFSPSGYEVKKQYPYADIICYLPIDRRCNAMRFFDTIRIEKAIFIKYEFWRNFLLELQRRHISSYLVSAYFYPSHTFFRPLGYFYRQLLSTFTHLFVQDGASQSLLAMHQIHNTTTAGDTRIDRVYQIAQSVTTNPIVESFAQKQQTLIAGSTWGKDEEIVIQAFNRGEIKQLIIAPHSVTTSRIEAIKKLLKRPYILYSEAQAETLEAYDCIIVDTIGLLSSLYQYGSIAYIGGGFGHGIHNTLEAAVWKIPIIFGPNYKKFKEANDLIQCGAAMAITNQATFSDALQTLTSDHKAGERAFGYIKSNLGATTIITNKIFNS